ncbi:MAG TPA: hypothetical protein VK973_07260 [Arenicellales bacterium]|nr:hypothetical protein [Arenicellales bacterium]
MSHPLNPGSSATIFERCGGFAKVSRIVMSFYDRVGDSEILAPYFETTDMRVLVDHQTKFVASLMGGPASYGDETLSCRCWPRRPRARPRRPRACWRNWRWTIGCRS